MDFEINDFKEGQIFKCNSRGDVMLLKIISITRRHLLNMNSSLIIVAKYIYSSGANLNVNYDPYVLMGSIRNGLWILKK